MKQNHTVMTSNFASNYILSFPHARFTGGFQKVGIKCGSHRPLPTSPPHLSHHYQLNGWKAHNQPVGGFVLHFHICRDESLARAAAFQSVPNTGCEKEKDTLWWLMDFLHGRIFTHSWSFSNWIFSCINGALLGHLKTMKYVFEWDVNCFYILS